MITGWIVKLVLGLAVLGFAAFEVGSPVLVRAQLDSVAHDAADDAAFTLRDRNNPEAARTAAEDRVAKDNAELAAFEIDDQRRVHLTVRKQAKSFVLENVDTFESWYDVKVSATGEGKL